MCTIAAQQESLPNHIRETITVTPEIEDRVRKTIIRTFNLSPEDGNRELRMGSLPGWDSLGHMRLVVELEEEFGVSFPAYLLPEILDMDSIVRETLKLQSEQ
jgi:acyl carrier protein